MVDPQSYAIKASAMMDIGARRPDLLGPISHSERTPFDTLFPFMKNALLPGASENASPNRLDVMIMELLTSVKGATKILDLGCGGWLLFQKLLESHPEKHLGGACTYIGVDTFQSEDDPAWARLNKGACKQCFPNTEHFRFDFLQLEILGTVLKKGPFDHIYLANVFHELHPKRGLALLEVLFNSLTPTGSLVIIDPDWKWCISPAAWTSQRDYLAGLPVEWETDAVWQSDDSINDILRAMGFEAKVALEKRSTNFWVAIASRSESVPVPRISDARTQMLQQLTQQRDSEVSRIAALRNALREQFRHSDSLNGELFIRIMEFFAACASQCRRLEALQDVQGT